MERPDDFKPLGRLYFPWADKFVNGSAELVKQPVGDEALPPEPAFGGFMQNGLEILASIGLALGAVFGLAGSVVGDATLRSLFWGVDGVGLVMAAALLTLKFHRQKSDVVAAGFLVLTVGETVILSGAAMTLEAAAPSFAAGAALWATALFLISVPRAFPPTVRGLGVISGLLFAATAVMILSGQALTPLSRPLPYFAYPLFVLTIIGWIITILSRREAG